MKNILLLFLLAPILSNSQVNKYKTTDINAYVGKAVDDAIRENRVKRENLRANRERNENISYDYYRTGMKYLNNNQYDEALKYFNEASRHHCDPMVEYAAGVAIFKSGSKEKGCGYIYKAANNGVKIGDNWTCVQIVCK